MSTIDRLKTALLHRYRIERELGAGGMATVYLAEDLKHKRNVALKVLKPELAAVIGGERFLQEITTTAALQHPHILPLFDSGEADGFLFYVMPFIDGETLRSKLDRETQFGIDESVRIAVAVADALDYAHRHGVIHRDIKPENILLHDGRPVVADFGIALALSAAAGGRMTETGLSLGTPHYMSPEQATAEKEISARADIYSLASVLYEMLTGSPPHVGASAQQIIMKIVMEEAAPVSKLRKSVPVNVADAVAKALEKLPADRFATAREFGAALGDARYVDSARLTTTNPAGDVRRPAVPRWRDPVTVGLAMFAIGAGVVAALAMMSPQTNELVGRYEVQLPDEAVMAYRGSSEPSRLAISPDGTTLVYLGRQGANGAGGYATTQLYTRALGSLESRAIADTHAATRPAISLDGTLVAFRGGNNEELLRVVPLEGGPVITVADSGLASGPAWGPDNFVYFLGTGRKIRRVAATGGPIEDVVTLPMQADSATYSWVTILPGGHKAIVQLRPLIRSDIARYTLRTVDLRSGELGMSMPGIAAYYDAASRSLLYVTADGSLMAVPFNLSRAIPTGRPQLVVNGVAARRGTTDLAVGGGVLVYATDGANGAEFMAWVRPDGGTSPVDTAWTDTEFESFALSPDGARLAVTIGAGTGGDNQQRSDVWVKTLDHGPLNRLSFAGNANTDPSWSADGKYVSFVSARGGTLSIWRKRADGVGEEEPVVKTAAGIVETRWSADGQWLLASAFSSGRRDIVAMHLGIDTTLRPLLAEPVNEWKPDLSRDSKWLAYVSDESGTTQVFVRPFPNVNEGKWQISINGGTDPAWSRDGRELYFRSLDGSEILAADMSRTPANAQRRTVMKGAVEGQFELNGQDRMFELSSDGKRFLMSVNKTDDQGGALIVVQNFTVELRRALAAGKAK